MQQQEPCQHPPSSLHIEPYVRQEAEFWPAVGRHVLAQATEDTVVVYQAYTPSIGVLAAGQGDFRGIPGFSETRMTWVKTNFLWMAFRCGWASKPNQETVLAITLKRPFFERMLAASLSTSAGTTAKGPCIGADVVLQWDPDHLPDGSKHPGRRAVQLGLRGGVRDEYISGRHTVCIEDITPFVREMGAIAAGGEPRWVGLLVPSERVLRLRDEVRSHIAADAHPVH
ncbi:hypothetical protein CHLNCDRAFT_59736 [Chlorella variabilis]|uniref:DUF4291 domain-containing protein n=1 Tax=Chlorella variabilis TaxID=554065 RepID=E1ZL80_CHLVA|nr:hypothetical protein CHLNCDRAFT_59736 [Chlorella variabilis]EFN53513.1 hypothetical protein CHLNCDRAFT_59736 [Chlorella variabilis]|eukprot:XP_005845615.1 hypothetical protein CHLNCDRAFT_59736 [Chlorella variabilis]